MSALQTLDHLLQAAEDWPGSPLSEWLEQPLTKEESDAWKQELARLQRKHEAVVQAQSARFAVIEQDLLGCRKSLDKIHKQPLEKRLAGKSTAELCARFRFFAHNRHKAELDDVRHAQYVLADTSKHSLDLNHQVYSWTLLLGDIYAKASSRAETTWFHLAHYRDVLQELLSNRLRSA